MLTTNIFHQTIARSVKRCLCRTSSLSASITRSQNRARSMSSDRKEHLELTSDQYRDPQAVPAQIVSIKNLSSTVKGLQLKVDQKHIDGGLEFKPGQWMDFFIPRLQQVGGFSMCSSPSVLKSQGEIELAIKVSSWAPANWVHTRCRPGDWVTFRFGGDFYYPFEDLKERHSLLLLAGGVGINPLLSIFRHSGELLSAGDSSGPRRVSLLYTAATAEELLFREEISEQCSKRETFTSQFFVTREKTGSEEFTHRRMTKSDLENVLCDKEDTERKICFICGPPKMVEQVKNWLIELNVSAENIRYELWW